MRLSELTIIFLIIHVACDYHFQSQRVADEKTQRSSAVLVHISILMGVSLVSASIIAFLSGQWALLTLAVVICVSHWAIDLIKLRVTQQWTKKGLLDDSEQHPTETPEDTNRRKNCTIIRKRFLYGTDQLLHIAFICLAIEWVYLQRIGLPDVSIISRNILYWILLVLLITKPANITHSILFSKYQPFEQKDEPNARNACKVNPLYECPASVAKSKVKTEPGAGALIGDLERIISVLLISVAQYAAIGFIYTAKSVARFKRIEEDPRFAEYYLIGTLYSILYALLAYFGLQAVIY